MKLVSLQENKDGSITVKFDMTKKEVDFYLELGVNKALADAILEFESNLGVVNHEPPKPRKRKANYK